MFKRKIITESQVLKNFFFVKFKPLSKATKKGLEKAGEQANENIRKNSSIYDSSNSHFIGSPVSSVNRNETNYIYVYIGTYETNIHRNSTNPTDILVSFDSSRAEYREYMKIEEPSSIKKVAIFFQEKFERDNIVLYPPKGKDKISYFNEVKELYFNTLREYGKVVAIEKILEFQSTSLRSTFSLEELVEYVSRDDDEEFEMELPSHGQKLKLTDKK